MSATTQVTTKDTDLAWAAGVFDGEGCVLLAKHTTGNRKTESWLLRADVANTDPKMLVKLRAIFGGTIVKKKLRDRYMPQWRWIVYGPNAASVLTAMLPYLITKKEQAEVALLSRKFLRGKHEVNQEKLDNMRWAGQKLKDLKRNLPSLEEVE